MTKHKPRRPTARRPSRPRDSVGSFESPRTGQIVHIIPKKGESVREATMRVRRRHGV